MATDLVVPALGESISEAVIGKWLKKVGEATKPDEPVVDLETDKISVQLPSPTAGVLVEQRYAEGATVRVGEVIGRIDEAGAARTASPPSTPSPSPSTSTSMVAAPAPVAVPAPVAAPVAVAAPAPVAVAVPAAV